MREILFRGKNEYGVWVYGMYIPYQNGEAAILHEKFSAYGHEATEICQRSKVIPETVGQYIGITDKNGRRIFEGDIVKADDYIFVVAFGKCGGVPNCENYGYMGFYIEALSEGTKACAHYGLRNDVCYFTDLEIIGNVHDNPEWLKGGGG